MVLNIKGVRAEDLEAALRNKPARVGRAEKTETNLQDIKTKCSGTSTSEEYWKGAMFHQIICFRLNISVYLDKM